MDWFVVAVSLLGYPSGCCVPPFELLVLENSFERNLSPYLPLHGTIPPMYRPDTPVMPFCSPMIITHSNHPFLYHFRIQRFS
ncbi:hypothetical protein M408DRAFT_333827 [Serendipita vermifera MAFF 305830]|uniref:Secreted protein n=1 Tax=Serendipita vermifera MAFF 305830 TaxID=933852 RepID=A0A0C3ANC0_SERVB|nr:hypothetical protein M408DRAFT_333827 [Serendipita vermifera MAFF 305830]